MRRLLTSAVLVAALALPAAPAAAYEPGPPAGIRGCGPMQIGFVVWVADPKTGEQQGVVQYCVPIGP